jgi:hypothetical protein
MSFKSGIAYFGVRNPEWVKLDMERIVAAGFTHVLHTWSEEDSHYYADTMSEIISISHSLGLKVYVNPWGVGRVFGGEAYSELSARDHSLAQVGSDGVPRVAACPNHPKFREYMHKWIALVCATQVETIFWDEPHFDFTKGVDQVWNCRCATCMDLFATRFGKAMPTQFDQEVKIFREDSLIDFLTEMTQAVEKLGKRNSVCMLPPWFPAGLDDWDRVARIPSVHEIGSDPYWEKNTPIESVPVTYAEVSAKTFAIAKQHGKEAQMWIKNYHIVAGTENAVVEATRAAFEAGIRNIFAWSYLGSSYLSWLRSDNAPLVWKLQCEALQHCKTSHLNSL